MSPVIAAAAASHAQRAADYLHGLQNVAAA